MPDLNDMEQFGDYLQDLPPVYGFGDWLESTRRLQEIAYDAHYDEMGDEERADSMMMNLFAATAEIVEMGDEMGWKPWAPPRGWINREAAIREAVDVLHFIGNLLTHAKCTGEELTEAYRAKQLKNLKRQIDNYDGRNKCGYCHRELDNPDPVSNLEIWVWDGIKYCNKDHYDKYKEIKH